MLFLIRRGKSHPLLRLSPGQKPDAMYAASLMPSLGLFIRQMRVAGFDGVILTTDAFAYPYIQAAAGQYAKGTVYIDFPATDAAKAFAEKYKSSFSKDMTPAAVLCYDGLSIIIDAWHKANGKAPSQVVSENLEGWDTEECMAESMSNTVRSSIHLKRE